MKKVRAIDVINQFFMRTDSSFEDLWEMKSVKWEKRKNVFGVTSVLAYIEIKIKKNFILSLEGFLDKEGKPVKGGIAINKDKHASEIILSRFFPLIGPNPSLSLSVYDKKNPNLFCAVFDYFFTEKNGYVEDYVLLTVEELKDLKIEKKVYKIKNLLLKEE